jgi:signal transduction histidine kinase
LNKKFILVVKSAIDKEMKILSKSIFYFLSLGVLVLVSVSFIFYFQFKSALVDRTLEQLSSVNKLKKTAIEEVLLKKEASGNGLEGSVSGDTALLKNIQRLLLERTGLGETGESYIVGSDFKMRSLSRFFPNKNPLEIEVHSEGVKNALEGKEGKSLLSDYRGIAVLSAYSKIEIKDLKWALLSEIDEREVVAALENIKIKLLIIAALIFAFILFISIVISRKMEMLTQQSKAALVQGQEEERSRLSKDIHDGAGPLLTSIKLQLSALKIEEEEKGKLKQMIDETITEMRRISYNLMPSVLLDFGVGSAIKNLVESLSKSAKCNIFFVDDTRKKDGKITPEINVALYRIAQEALNNSVKHADASTIKISITEFPEKVSLYVFDNGTGFKSDAENKSGSGLKNMRERVSLLNGEIFINSDDAGTTVEVEIPFI